MEAIDRTDRRILENLQIDGKLSNVELSNRVGLSESACLRRVKNLEKSGVIDRYVAILNQGEVGLASNVFVRVSLDRQTEKMLLTFEQAVTDVPEVMECFLMSGDVDFMIRVVVHDASDYERVHNILCALPNVSRVHSSFALRTVLKRTRLPMHYT